MSFLFRNRTDRSDRKRLIARTGEILGWVVFHGFGYLLETPERRKGRWKRLPSPKQGTPETSRAQSRWVRVRRLLEDLGPTFVKMGQMFSNRPDLLPEELLVELRKLQDKVPGFPFSEVRRVIEEELGQPVESLFSRFETEPVASASIAQVHEAVLQTGQRVAVKVMRVGIESRVRTDLEILSRIGLWFEKIILRSDVIDTQGILREFSKTLLKEMDFVNEGVYLEKFGHQFRDDPNVLVPKLYKRVSSKRVLVMDFVSGFHPADEEGYRRYGLQKKDLAERGARLVLKQIFVFGFFHADPHPGNLLILADGRVAFLDFGMMGVIFVRHREKLAEMLLAVSSGDSSALAAALLEMALNPPSEESAGLEEDVFALLENFSHLPVSEIDVTAFLQKTVNLILQHRLVMPPSLYLLLKALITIDGLARSLDPEFDLLTQLEPFVREIYAQKWNPLRAGGKGAESTLDYLSHAASLPRDLSDALKQVKRGRLKLELDQDLLSQLLHKADRISNRLAFSLIVTGGVVASSVALQSKIPPLWNDIPIIAIVGYIGSGLMGFALLISIWRSGRF